MPDRELLLPAEDRTLVPFSVPDARDWPKPQGPIESRVAYAAAHVVADPLAAGGSPDTCTLDWDATLAYRRLLWSYGLGVAEAMDTAQRGMGLGWEAASELIERSVAAAKIAGGRIACGVGTDQLDPSRQHTLDAVIRAYCEQCAWVERCGGRIILMASRALASVARSGDEYRAVYDRLLRQVREPVILHWLGEMFDPALRGYWGPDPMEGCLEIIHANASKVDGIKVSLLDASLEIEMRRRLPRGVRMYTGDDFAYPDLIAGDEQGYSDALLGIFDAIAPAASAALQALDRDDRETYQRLLDPTVALSRTIFEAPTYNYKTGIVFLAYLNGYQRHFRMVDGRESARSILHLSRVFRQAAEAGLLIDPDLACQRVKWILAQAGVC